MKLTINDMAYGECKAYHQDRSKSAWIFKMENETEIIMPFVSIKLFTSSGSLDVLTNTKYPLRICRESEPEYIAVLCGVQPLFDEDELPVYKFPGGICCQDPFEPGIRIIEW